MLFAIFIYLSVFSLVSTSHTLLQERQGSYDITRSGRYTIVNCGNRDAARLVALLDDLWTLLQPAIRDSSLVEPSPAFRTFFNSASNAPYVRQLLMNVTTGVSLYPPEEPFHQTGSPLFICATGGGQVVGKRGGIDYYLQCILDAYDSLIAISGTPYIVVCPYLFSSGVPDSPPADKCLTVNTSIHRFREMGLDFRKFRVWILLEGILRYYIYATTGSSGSFATDVNKCVRLGAKQMAENPSNYVYYAASIYGQCRDFPDFSVPRRRPLENTTTPDSVHADNEGPNATSTAGVTSSDQAVVVDLSGSMEIRST